MKRKTKKILSHLPAFISEYLEWFLSDASENHIRITRARKNKFRSYTQLKKYQKRLKFFGIGSVSVVLSLFVGLVIGPVIMPTKIESELYIPNGKGDILLANISKNQITIVFKTLDSANENKPFATKAFVEVFEDSNYAKFVSRSKEDDYAVTHIIPIDSLQEGVVYYFRITAKDASIPSITKTVYSWGDGNEPIKAYAIGEMMPVCPLLAGDASKMQDENTSAEKNEKITIPVAESSESFKYSDSAQDAKQIDDNTLQISGVLNENHLQPKNKVQTIISWYTNIPSSTVLVYGEGRSNEKTEVIVNKEMQKKHLVVLTTLKPATTYYFNAKSVGENQEIAISEEYSLRTPKPQSTIVDKIAESFISLFRQIKPL